MREKPETREYVSLEQTEDPDQETFEPEQTVGVPDLMERWERLVEIIDP